MSNFAKPISDIQRAYLSLCTGYVKDKVYGGMGYGKLGRELTGTGANMNATTLMRWHKAVEGIGIESDEFDGVKVLPNPANLMVLAKALPDGDTESDDTEIIYLSVLDDCGIDTEDLTEDSIIESEHARKAGYALPVTKEMFAYVFNLSLADSRKFPDQIKHLDSRVSDLESFQSETESELSDLNTKVSGIRQALNNYQDKVSSELAALYSGGTISVNSGIDHDILNRIQTLEDSVSRVKLQNNLNGNVRSESDLGNILSTLMENQNRLFSRLITAINPSHSPVKELEPVEVEKYTMVDPLETVRAAIIKSELSLEELADYSGTKLENVQALLRGDFDGALSDPTLPFRQKAKAESTLNNVIVTLNKLIDADLSVSEVQAAYTKAKNDESIKIHHPELELA